MAKKKKPKHKRKPRRTCPHGHIYGQDGIDKKECDKCRIAEACGDKSFYYEERRKKERRKKKEEEHRKEKPQKSKKKHSKKTSKPKKLKQDNRGAYIPPPALNKLLKLSYHYCTNLYLGYMAVGIEQETNRPWANNYYMAKRLGLGISSIVIAKSLLRKAGFIKVIIGKREKGHYPKHYIELKYYPCKEIVEKQEYLHQMKSLFEITDKEIKKALRFN